MITGVHVSFAVAIAVEVSLSRIYVMLTSIMQLCIEEIESSITASSSAGYENFPF
jgi:hypothetical protein